MDKEFIPYFINVKIKTITDRQLLEIIGNMLRILSNCRQKRMKFEWDGKMENIEYAYQAFLRLGEHINCRKDFTSCVLETVQSLISSDVNSRWKHMFDIPGENDTVSFLEYYNQFVNYYRIILLLLAEEYCSLDCLLIYKKKNFDLDELQQRIQCIELDSESEDNDERSWRER